tara:strand:+ start:54 stop:887 length:834 start_codon:yes stop_codon:yes gene_type:complete
MTKSKTIKNILLILLIVFIAIPFLFMFFDFKIHEGMTDGNNGQHNFKMDRANISSITGVSGDYLYCPAGNITCPPGTNLNRITDSDSSYSLGDSFNFYCTNSSGVDTSSNVICNNSLKQHSNVLNLPKDCNNQEITFNLQGISSIQNISGETINGLEGFIKKDSNNVPMDVSGDYVILYKDDGTYNETKNCFLEHGGKANCCDHGGGGGGGGDDHHGGGGSCEPEKIKCLANNNAQIGDPLCCGQSGVVQNTKYNCPSEFPSCVGYKCGESWGHCTK